MARPYRAGWVIHESPAGRTASRNGRTLPQGQMSYHAFIVCLDRIAGLRPWEDVMPGLRNGLGIDAAYEAAIFTEEEAWAKAEAMSKGLPWAREAATPPPPPPPQPDQAPEVPTPEPPDPRALQQQALFDFDEL